MSLRHYDEFRVDGIKIGDNVGNPGYIYQAYVHQILAMIPPDNSICSVVDIKTRNER